MTTCAIDHPSPSFVAVRPKDINSRSLSLFPSLSHTHTDTYRRISRRLSHPQIMTAEASSSSAEEQLRIAKVVAKAIQENPFMSPAQMKELMAKAQQEINNSGGGGGTATTLNEGVETKEEAVVPPVMIEDEAAALLVEEDESEPPSLAKEEPEATKVEPEATVPIVEPLMDMSVITKAVDPVKTESPSTSNNVTMEEPPQPSKRNTTSEPQPLQIVSIGTEDDAFAFKFHEDKLNEIIRKIPPGWKVAVVSVVGAFRTGKSFLLSWFLKYIHHLNSKGHDDTTKKWYEQVDTLGHDSGFEWRGGSDRNTTGIWMWSQPHFITKPTEDGKEETMAILLVDSQGMFDNETTMSLTASIFGLSTLLSSYQIYNVDKRIQEDNLQQLALFSEYARLAVEADQAFQLSGVEIVKPFQKMEFLVRDWQHFEEEQDYDSMEKEMGEYLEKVIAERDAKDLQETREQILACFDSLSCFGLCHPGMSVIKKSYDGRVDKIEKDFLELLDRYCKRVFSVDNLLPKTIQGRQVTAAELAAYIKAYAEMFASGASFPEATTMLEATAAANNQNAVNLAIAQYKDTMGRIAGPKCSNYIRPKELTDDHKALFAKALEAFDTMATFGSKKSIEGSRRTVIAQIEDDFETYQSLNASRNPLAGFETYVYVIQLPSRDCIIKRESSLLFLVHGTFPPLVTHYRLQSHLSPTC
jgi:atlastin